MRITIFDTLSTRCIQDAAECLTRQTIHKTHYYSPVPLTVRPSISKLPTATLSSIYSTHHPFARLHAKGYTVRNTLADRPPNRAIPGY